MRQLILVSLVLSIAGSACSDEAASARLTVYSGRSEELVGPLIDRFEADTGIDVEVRYAGSTELAATLLEEGASSRADVFFAQDPASLGTVALAGRFAELPDAAVRSVPKRFADAAGGWVGVSGRVRTVAYDTSEVSPGDLPRTEDGLANPEWAGRTAIAPTNGSFLSFVAAKILLDGAVPTLEWLTAMADHGALSYPSNSAIVAAVGDGQAETGLVNHYYPYRLRTQDPDVPVENYFFPEATAGSLVMPAGIGILASTENPTAAEAFVAYLLSRSAQEYFAAETFEYPLAQGVPAAPGLPPLDTLATPDLDLSRLATELDAATDLVAEAGLL